MVEMKDILIDLREEKNLNQADIAKLLNVVPATISKYERGKSYPEHDGMVKLADFYNVNLDYLFGRTSIQTSMKDLEKALTAEGGMIPIDLIFKLKPDDRELVRRLLETIAKDPDYADKPAGRHKR